MAEFGNKEASNEEVNYEELLAVGRTCLLARNDWESAVDVLGKVCQLMSDKFGEMNEMLAEPYCLYGKALLGLARMESSVFGGGVSLPQEEEEEEEEEEEGESEGEEEEEEKDELKGLENESDVTSAINGQDQTESNEGEEKGEEKGEGEGEGDQKKVEDESTLQTAWEVLEVCRIICQKAHDKQLLLAEVNLLLGEIGLERDDYDQAVDDMKTCLQLRESVMTPDNRALAEIHYQLGLAHHLANNYTESLDEYQKSLQVMEVRLEKLELDLGRQTEEKEKLIKEIEDIRDIIPEIKLKISDAIYLIEHSNEVDKEIHQMHGKPPCPPTSTVSSSTAIRDDDKISSSTDVVVNDITHLVRKKPAVSTSVSMETTSVPVDAPMVTTSDQPTTRKRSYDDDDDGNDNEVIPHKKSCSIMEPDSTTSIEH